MTMLVTFEVRRGTASRLWGALAVAAVIGGATSSAALAERAPPIPSTEDAKAEVVDALLSLDNLIDAIHQSDACLSQSNIDVLGPLQDRIAEARLRTARLIPERASIVDSGDSDWVCDRSRPDGASSPSALRKQAGRSIDRLEAALNRLEGKALSR